MIKKKPILEGIDPLKNALNRVDLLQFVFFYQQLGKLKSNRESYHIEFVLKSCYPQLAVFDMEEIEKFVSKFKSQNSFQIP
ncbi:MAG: hypothetical protein P8H18_00995 [Flavobacteriaceae bacterium]|jgi:hypothetical protein|nr:hypothetical protein [Flavobacteriaceae bacterium]